MKNKYASPGKATMLIFTILLSVITLANIPGASARFGHITALTVIDENDTLGSTADISLEIRPGSGVVFIESYPLTKVDTQMSARMAQEIACQRSTVDCTKYDFFYEIKTRSSLVGGPSAGGAITVLTYAVLENLPLDNDTAMTGTILSGGVIGPVGGVSAKIAGARANGFHKILVPGWDSASTDNKTKNSISIAEGAAGIVSHVSSWNTSVQNSNNFASGATNDNGVQIIPIRTLGEAIQQFTGRAPPSESDIVVPAGYTEGMKQVRETLCERARILRTSMDDSSYNNNTHKYSIDSNTHSIGNNTNATNSNTKTNTTIIESNVSDDPGKIADAAYAHAMDAIMRGHEYTAASQCFASGLTSQTEILRQASPKSLITVAEHVRRDADAIASILDNTKLRSISDLEVAMIVRERLADANDELAKANASGDESNSVLIIGSNASTSNESNNLTDTRENTLDPVALAYASERLETARAWFTLLGHIKSKELDISDARLADSCSRKLDEAQERINYLGYIYPGSTAHLEEALRVAYKTAQDRNSALCLLEAAQAKVEANAILTAVSVSESSYRDVVREKLLVSKRQIARQSAADTFPILGYSDEEYAEELLNRDPYGGARYAEESLELDSLAIYFPNRNPFPIIDLQTSMVFFTGSCLGLLFGILITFLFFRRRERNRKSTKSR